MPFNGSGVYERTNGDHTGTNLWEQDRDGAIKVTAERHDAHDEDLATAINNCLAKDGQNAMTGNLNMGSQSITNLGGITGDLTATGTLTAAAIQPASPATVLFIQNAQEVRFTSDVVVVADTTLNDVSILGNVTGNFGHVEVTDILRANSDLKVVGDATFSGNINGQAPPDSGSYTPVVSSSNADGTFTEISADAKWSSSGNFVTVSIDVIYSISGSPTGTLQISLPHTSDGTTSGAGNVGLYQGISTDKGLYGYITAGSNQLTFQKDSDGSDQSDTVTMSDVASTLIIRVTATYIRV